MSNNVLARRDLDALFVKKEGGVREWLDDAGDFLHPCVCGRVVYDPAAVSRAVQQAFGAARTNEIFDWTSQLAERFGWGQQAAAAPERGLYYCQHCDPRHRK